MARKPDPHMIDDENPEWSDADFARARPAAEVMSPALYAALTKRPRGRPKAEKRKVEVKLRLDPEVVEAFKAQGPGWQTRMNDALLRAVKHAEPAKQALPARTRGL